MVGAISWTDVVSVAVGLAAFLVALGVIGRVFRRPVGWVTRHLVGQPISGWFREQVHEVMRPAIETVQRELCLNAGSSVKDQVRSTAEDMQSLHDELKAVAVIVRRARPDDALPGGQRHTDPPAEETP